MNYKKMVSVIIPLYNSEKYIETTIESVINQTYKNWELLIIDDNSKDNGVVIVKEYIKKDSRIKLLVNSQNMGAAKTRNYGIKEAKGEYIAFLDSDDLWNCDKLEKQINFMEKNNYSVTYTGFKKVFIDTPQKGEYISKHKESLSYKELLKANWLSTFTVIYNQEILGKKYFPDIRAGQDYGLWLDLAKENGKIYGMDEILGTYRVHVGSLSSNKIRRIKLLWKLYREYNKLSILDSIRYLFTSTIYSQLGLKAKKIK